MPPCAVNYYIRKGYTYIHFHPRRPFRMAQVQILHISDLHIKKGYSKFDIRIIRYFDLLCINTITINCFGNEA